MTNLPKAVEEFWKTYYLDIYGDAEFSFQIGQFRFDSDIASSYTEILLNHPNSPIRNLIRAASELHNAWAYDEMKLGRLTKLGEALAALQPDKPEEE